MFQHEIIITFSIIIKVLRYHTIGDEGALTWEITHCSSDGREEI